MRRRFFVDAVEAGLAHLRGEDARHLARVLRAEPGQRYEISDSRSLYVAEVVESAAAHVVFRVLERVESPAPPVHISLSAALIKFDRFEWIIEKATELGVERILPVVARRTEKGLAEAAGKRLERWRRIAHESSQQSRRLRAPQILPPVSFERSAGETAGLRFFLDEEQAPPLLELLPARREASDTVALLTGPEGGWTGEERSAVLGSGWLAVSLSQQILRAETAAAAAMAIVANAWMCKREPCKTELCQTELKS